MDEAFCLSNALTNFSYLSESTNPSGSHIRACLACHWAFPSSQKRRSQKKNLFEQYVLIVSYFFLVLYPSSLILPAPCKYLSPSIASLPANLSHHPHPQPTHSANYSLPPSTLSSFSLPTLCKTTFLSLSLFVIKIFMTLSDA